VICLDEADLLAKNETSVQTLRSVFEELRGYIVVLSGTDELLEKLGLVFGPIQRFFDHIRLGPLESVGEVFACLQAPLPSFEREVVDEAFAAEVYGLTGGHPFQVKLMAFHAYRAMKEASRERLRIDPAIVDAVLAAATTTGFADLSERLGKRKEQPFEVDLKLGEDAFSTDREDLPAEDEAQEVEVVGLANRLIIDAFAAGASELQIVPDAGALTVRTRIDGVWRQGRPLPRHVQGALMSRIKILGRLDISERRLPQNGRTSFAFRDKHLQISITVLPTVAGETAHLQFLATSGLIPLQRVGFADEELKFLELTLSRPGIIVVAGPEDSGKTALVYSLLNRVLAPETSVAAIERLPKMILAGVTQYRPVPLIDLTARRLTESVLRTGVDVLYVEDAVEPELLEYLCYEASAGKRVIVSTRQAATAIDALGLVRRTARGFVVARSVSVVIACRLLRALCSNCRTVVPSDQPAVSDPVTVARIPVAQYRSVGCVMCNGIGYKGRVGIYEVLRMTDSMREALEAGAPQADLASLARREGAPDLLQAATRQVEAGVTSADEVMRVFAFERETAMQ
jgi:type II secretory ATPase GspE/PulE/Tfp pilus assembly ATPase PilB-like protein